MCKKLKIINKFFGEYRFLSNFYLCEIIWEGEKWKSSEHIYQSMKTTKIDEKNFIRMQPTPGKSKRMSKKITLRKDWNQVKVKIMKEILFQKFTQNLELMKKLKETDDSILIEGNTWHDNFWGICECEKCSKKEGKNILGNLLMEIREI